MTINSREDLAGMTRVGKLVGEAIQEMKAAVKPGMTTAELDEIGAVFGGDPWPYGVEPNRPTLNALVRYLEEQGVIAKAPKVDELFVPVRQIVPMTH